MDEGERVEEDGLTSFVPVIASVLNHITHRNKEVIIGRRSKRYFFPLFPQITCTSDALKVFHSLKVPPIGTSDYLNRFVCFQSFQLPLNFSFCQDCQIRVLQPGVLHICSHLPWPVAPCPFPNPAFFPIQKVGDGKQKLPHHPLQCASLVDYKVRFSIHWSPLSFQFFFSVLLAAKARDDTYYSNAYYAAIGGISNAEMNKLEGSFLVLVDFKYDWLKLIKILFFYPQLVCVSWDICTVSHLFDATLSLPRNAVGCSQQQPNSAASLRFGNGRGWEKAGAQRKCHDSPSRETFGMKLVKTRDEFLVGPIV